jgi:actin
MGDGVRAKAAMLFLRSPIERGVVTNWYNMEKIWHYTFYNELRVDPSEHPVFLTEAALTPKRNREKMIQLMFDTFDVPSFFVGNQCVLSLHSSGRTTGIVVEVGDGVCQIVPVYKSTSLRHATTLTTLTGRDLTKWLRKALIERNYMVKTAAEREIVRDIREKLAYVALDFEAERRKAERTTDCDCSYTLPDGTTEIRRGIE